MSDSKYRLRYLPLFYEDLSEKAEYIAYEKQNPAAAARLINAVEAAVLERLPIAESFEPYPSMLDRKYPFVMKKGWIGPALDCIIFLPLSINENKLSVLPE